LVYPKNNKTAHYGNKRRIISMETNGVKKVICATSEDHKYVDDLWKKIIDAYKNAASLAGVKPKLGKRGDAPKMRHVVSFLREHAVYGDREIQNFAARFVK